MWENLISVNMFGTVRGPALLVLVVLAGKADGYPIIWDMFHMGCQVPDKAYGGHGPPVMNPNVTLMVSDMDGAAVNSYMAGETYNISMPAYSGATLPWTNAWVHVSAGTLEPFDECNCRFKQASNCTKATYSSGQIGHILHEFKWTAPEGAECVTMTAVQVELPSVAFQKGVAEICGEGSTERGNVTAVPEAAPEAVPEAAPEAVPEASRSLKAVASGLVPQMTLAAIAGIAL